MAPFQPLLHFYKASVGESGIAPAHMGLYMTLLKGWKRRWFETTNVISRNELIRFARISRWTYNKCMKDLHVYGYITYLPFFNPFIQSKVNLTPGIDLF